MVGNLYGHIFVGFVAIKKRDNNKKFLFRYLKKLPGKWLVPVIAAIWVAGVGFHLMSTSLCIILTALIVGGWLLYLLFLSVSHAMGQPSRVRFAFVAKMALHSLVSCLVRATHVRSREAHVGSFGLWR